MTSRFCLSLVLAQAALSLAAQTQQLPLTPEAWDANDLPIRFVEHRGRQTLHIGAADQALEDHTVDKRDFVLRDGTLEYDYLPETDGFAGVHFRRVDKDNSELVYLRTFFAGESRVTEALQYAAIVKGVNYWDLRPEYQAAVEIKGDDWNHVKLVVLGQQLLVYVNDMTAPALYVPQLDGGIREGRIGFSGRGYYANVRFDPGTPELAGEVGYFAGGRDGRYLNRWRVSPPEAIPFDRSLTRLEVPRDTTTWRTVDAEHLDLVNLSRPFGKTPSGERRLCWLKTTLNSDVAREVAVDFGFSDAAAVYVNGRLLFADENRYGTPQMRYPKGRLSIDNAQFRLPLEAGDNEVAVALSNDFFGWGLKMRVREVTGVR